MIEPISSFSPIKVDQFFKTLDALKPPTIGEDESIIPQASRIQEEIPVVSTVQTGSAQIYSNTMTVDRNIMTPSAGQFFDAFA